jgi:hypothetical protein
VREKGGFTLASVESIGAVSMFGVFGIGREDARVFLMISRTLDDTKGDEL